MIIDIAVEKESANFNIHTNDVNFPYKFNFMDRTTGIIVQVGLDYDSFHNLMEKLNSKMYVSKDEGSDRYDNVRQSAQSIEKKLKK